MTRSTTPRIAVTALLLITTSCILELPNAEEDSLFACVSDAQCPEAFVCMAGFCRDPEAWPQPPCRNDDDCDDPNICIDGVCGLPDVPPPPPYFVKMALGWEHTCGILDDGTLWCWGANTSGQLGVGDTAERTTPAQVGTRNDWQRVAAGSGHTCAIAAGELYCWGGNGWSQLGIGSQPIATCPIDGVPCSQTPVRVGSLATWSEVVAGYSHTCALDNTGAAWCWGDASSGTLGIGDTTGLATCSGTPCSDTPLAVNGAMGWSDITTAGGSHTCALQEAATRLEPKRLWCWGYNENHQAGGWDRFTPVAVPEEVDNTLLWKAASAGPYNSCGVVSDGRLACIGYNAAGLFGEDPNTYSMSSVPFFVGTATDWKKVATGSFFACALNQVGDILCWGRNLLGELGIGSQAGLNSCGTSAFPCTWVPLPVAGDRKWSDLWAGPEHICAREAVTNTAYCWGRADFGQLGTGDSYAVCTTSGGNNITCSLSPQPVAMPTP